MSNAGNLTHHISRGPLRGDERFASAMLLQTVEGKAFAALMLSWPHTAAGVE